MVPVRCPKPATGNQKSEREYVGGHYVSILQAVTGPGPAGYENSSEDPVKDIVRSLPEQRAGARVRPPVRDRHLPPPIGERQPDVPVPRNAVGPRFPGTGVLVFVLSFVPPAVPLIPGIRLAGPPPGFGFMVTAFTGRKASIPRIGAVAEPRI